MFIVIRLTLLLLGMSLLTLSTTTLNITDGFEELLKPFKRFGVPAHELATMMGIALRFLPQFATELQTIYRAQVSRGANFKTNARGTFSMMVALIVPLFTSAFRHAETLSLGMDARCYHGGTNRTSLHELRFQKCDLARSSLFYVAVGVPALIQRRYRHGIFSDCKEQHMDEVIDYLTNIPAWFFATCEGDQPRVRPFSFAAEDGGKLWFCTATNKRCLCSAGKANPKFEASGWHPGQPWIVVNGRSRFGRYRERSERASAGYEHMTGPRRNLRGPRRCPALSL